MKGWANYAAHLLKCEPDADLATDRVNRVQVKSQATKFEAFDL